MISYCTTKNRISLSLYLHGLPLFPNFASFISYQRCSAIHDYLSKRKKKVPTMYFNRTLKNYQCMELLIQKITIHAHVTTESILISSIKFSTNNKQWNNRKS